MVPQRIVKSSNWSALAVQIRVPSPKQNRTRVHWCYVTKRVISHHRAHARQADWPGSRTSRRTGMAVGAFKALAFAALGIALALVSGLSTVAQLQGEVVGIWKALGL